eukprot:TRINITY_DN6312_c0_g3_i2.p1 TRINITY_DN6312_c0_g3~~TRINITY_DN6312_c0_g3_i2.p1  ORF type:complete len:111 (+),score=17.58 TRINITY_DN6312_c0_g3_i2:567-899(+)
MTTSCLCIGIYPAWIRPCPYVPCTPVCSPSPPCGVRPSLHPPSRNVVIHSSSSRVTAISFSLLRCSHPLVLVKGHSHPFILVAVGHPFVLLEEPRVMLRDAVNHLLLKDT